MNGTEARAVNTVLTWLLDVRDADGGPTPREDAEQAAAYLADRAAAALHAGITGDRVRDHFGEARPDDQLAELHEANRQLNAEYTALHDRYMRLLTQRQRWSERVRAAARRTEVAHVLAFAELQVRRAMSSVGGDAFYGVLRLVRELPERPPKTQVRALRSAAENAELLRRHQAEGDGEPAAAYRAQRAEEARLREHITVSGRALHAQLGTDGGDPESLGCECPGCALIIGMDLTPDDAEPAPGAAEAES